jgi:hypothetical protein
LLVLFLFREVLLAELADSFRYFLSVHSSILGLETFEFPIGIDRMIEVPDTRTLAKFLQSSVDEVISPALLLKLNWLVDFLLGLGFNLWLCSWLSVRVSGGWCIFVVLLDFLYHFLCSTQLIIIIGG